MIEREALAWCSLILAAATLTWSFASKASPEPDTNFIRGRSFTLPTPDAPQQEESTIRKIGEYQGVPLLPFEHLAFPDYDPPELRGSTPTALTAEDYPDTIAPYGGQTVAIEGYPMFLDMPAEGTQTLLLTRFPPGCCFGAVPVQDEWVEVHVSETIKDYPSSYTPVVSKGLLHVSEQLDETGAVESLYRMTDATIGIAGDTH